MIFKAPSNIRHSVVLWFYDHGLAHPAHPDFWKPAEIGDIQGCLPGSAAELQSFPHSFTTCCSSWLTLPGALHGSPCRADPAAGCCRVRSGAAEVQGSPGLAPPELQLTPWILEGGLSSLVLTSKIRLYQCHLCVNKQIRCF